MASDRDAAKGRMVDMDNHPSVTHRVGLTLGVHAVTDEEAGRVAEAFYERFAKAVREVDGVLWLLPVADIKRKAPL